MEANGAGQRHAVSTWSWLRLGVVAGPFYLTVGVMQGLLRDGFDFGRHPLSVLANGPFGWIQTGNFVLTGLMVIAAAVGFRRRLGPRSRGVTWCLGGFGTAMIVAAVFPADPVDGFRPAHRRAFRPRSARPGCCTSSPARWGSCSSP